MLYPYVTLPDDTLVTHSHLKDENGVKTVLVHFERPIPYGFDSARCSLPTYKWVMRDGYSDEEILDFEQFLRDNAHLFYKYAEQGGMDIAKAV
jgi:hypothetical protein